MKLKYFWFLCSLTSFGESGFAPTQPMSAVKVSSSCYRVFRDLNGSLSKRSVGDLDGDGLVTQLDSQSIMKIYSYGKYDEKADLNGDRMVTPGDALIAAKIGLGALDELGLINFASPLFCNSASSIHPIYTLNSSDGSR